MAEPEPSQGEGKGEDDRNHCRRENLQVQPEDGKGGDEAKGLRYSSHMVLACQPRLSTQNLDLGESTIMDLG